jgi:hypothetical protein
MGTSAPPRLKRRRYQRPGMFIRIPLSCYNPPPRRLVITKLIFSMKGDAKVHCVFSKKKSLLGFLNYITIMPYNIHVSLYQWILDYCKHISIVVMTSPCNSTNTAYDVLAHNSRANKNNVNIYSLRFKI